MAIQEGCTRLWSGQRRWGTSGGKAAQLHKKLRDSTFCVECPLVGRCSKGLWPSREDYGGGDQVINKTLWPWRLLFGVGPSRFWYHNSTTGFKLSMGTWSDSAVWSASCSWLAFGTVKGLCGVCCLLCFVFYCVFFILFMACNFVNTSWRGRQQEGHTNNVKYKRWWTTHQQETKNRCRGW